MPCAADLASRSVTATTTTRSDIHPLEMNTWKQWGELKGRAELPTLVTLAAFYSFAGVYLVAVEDPVAAVPLGVRLHTLEIAGKKKKKTQGRHGHAASPRLRLFASNFLPAGARLSHADGADASPGGHVGDEALDLLLAAVVGDVGHDDVRVQGEARARAVGVHPAGEGKE